MYDLNPPRVFVHKRVHRNPQAMRRMERMLRALRNPRIEEVDVGDMDKVIEAAGAREELPVQSGRVRQGIETLTSDPVMLFNTFVWDEKEVKPLPRRYKNPRAQGIARHMAGTGRDFAYSRREQSDGSGPLCARAVGEFTPLRDAFTSATTAPRATL